MEDEDEGRLLHEDDWYEARRKGRWGWYPPGELPEYVKWWIQLEDEYDQEDNNG